jgi:hypothetical protein
VVERLAVNEDVAGSSPAAGANKLMFKGLPWKPFSFGMIYKWQLKDYLN